MQLISKFHKMESESTLFELGKEIDLPIWDIIRYNVYVKYYISKDDRQKLEATYSHPLIHYFTLIPKFLKLIIFILFKSGKIIFFTASRYKNNSGLYYDKSALPIIQTLSNRCLVVEATFERKLAYQNVYDISYVLGRVIGDVLISKKITSEYYGNINRIIIEYLGENLFSLEEMHKLLNTYKRTYYFYKILFFLKKTKKVFIATGNPKATVKAAKEFKIKTYLIQHAGIEFDEIDYSYPPEISFDSNILYPDYLLTLGNYWCKNINVPVKKITSIGNDFFYSKPNISSDNSILIISTIVHGKELSLLTKKLSECRTELKFVYKLHPNEFHLFRNYVEFFNKNPNVIILTDQTDTNQLIAKCQLVVIIVSAVLYEALNQNKKVAIYKKINYKRQLSLAHLPNVYFFDNPSEIFEILTKNVILSEVDFYKPTNYSLINQILSEHD